MSVGEYITDEAQLLADINSKLDRMVAFQDRLESFLNAYLSGGKGAALLALAKIHAARQQPAVKAVRR